MKRAGQIVIFEFPQTDLLRGKRRPALLLASTPGQYDDWLACMLSRELRQAVPDFDEIIQPSDVDFQQAGLKVASVIRLARLAVVESSLLVGTVGEISSNRLRRIREKLASWVNPR